MSDSSIPWFEQARKDFETAESLYPSDIFYASALFVHQAVNKMLKALLLGGGFIPPKTHDLLYLIKTIETELQISPAEIMDDLKDLNPNYKISRYPDAANGIPAEMYSRNKAEMILREGREVFSWCSQYLQ